jgi:hypothetical protein
MAGQQATTWMGSGTIFDAVTFQDAKRRQTDSKGHMQKIGSEAVWQVLSVYCCQHGTLPTDNIPAVTTVVISLLGGKNITSVAEIRTLHSRTLVLNSAANMRGSELRTTILELHEKMVRNTLLTNVIRK